MKIVNTPSIVVIVFLMCFVLVASAATPVAGGPPHYPFHWIKVHGWLMCLSMGLLMPVAIILIRFSRGYRESGDLKNVRTLVYVHTIIQVVAVLTVICSAAVAVTKFDNSFTYTHERLGLALWILVWLPPLVGLIRPNHGVTTRPIWYALHWLVGTGAVILGWYNIYTGLHAYEVGRVCEHSRFCSRFN